MELYMVYMTAKDAAEAEAVGRALVEKRLAACINILDGCKSLFWWDGGVQSENEVVFIAKTSAERLEALTAEVKAMHSYDVPCVAAIPIQGGNMDFLTWIDEETGQEP